MAGFNAFLKSNNIVTGTQIPTEGNYKTGDIVVNIGPNSAAEPMWICNEGGNPGVWGPVGVGGGSGSIVSINSSVMIDEPVNEVSLESLGVIVTKKDKLIVHYNSVHLLEGVHFEIAGNGTKIVKLGEGSWNEEGLEDCMFAFELFKGVESVDGDKIVVASKMTCKTNHVIIENPCGEVEIGIEGFNSENDTLMVFKNGVIMVEGVDYTIEGDIITSTGEVWNENGIEDYGMTFVVFKEVVEYEGESKIGMDHLADDVKQAIENTSNIDLSGYQSKEDEELVTNNKTVIGAINELFQNANNGKELIASAIGEPLNAEDTFSAMSTDINSLLSTFKTNMMNNGVTVESNDKFKSLIDKVDEKLTKDNNTINSLNTDKTNLTNQVNSLNTEKTNLTNQVNSLNSNIESTRNTLAGLMQEGGYNITGSENINSLLNLLVASGISASDIKQIDGGYSHTFILKNDGSVWSCGYNSHGQLGLGNNTDRKSLTKVTKNINNDVKQIACGDSHTVVLKNDGSVWACGANGRGQLGIGSSDTNTHTTFTQVTTNVKQIACGEYHTFILKNDGTVWSCGTNSYGQLGLNDTTQKTSFNQVTTNINKDVKQIVCGYNHTFILKTNGSVWACGANGRGQLGLGNNTDRTTFTQVTTNINNIKQIACGGEHTFILRNDGSVWSCGYNYNGQLGLNDTTQRTSFTKVTTNINNDVKQISCGEDYVFIVKNDGSLYSCGDNTLGQLGLNSTTQKTTFTQVTTSINKDVKQVVCCSHHVIIIKNDDSIYSCGSNSSGQLGLGHSTSKKTFDQVHRGF